MKIIHLADLHIGKRLNEFSMLEDQEYILKVILNIIDEQKPDAVVIAGDVYDKSVPSAEAVQLFDYFLVALCNRNIKTFVISGNHDSAERIAFGGRIMTSSGVYLSPVYQKDIQPIILEDEYGPLNVYMLPFIKPIHVRSQFPEAEILSYTDAVRTAIKHMNADTTKRNLLITHQFVIGATTCESEELSVGGSDQVDATAFEDFDYVALGHLHGPQQVSRETIRYSGTPLKYSFSESKHTKSVTLVDFLEKGTVNLTTIPLKPKRDLIEIKGKYMDITAKSYYESMNREDYIHIILTDEDDILDAIGRLRVIYPNIMKLTYDNLRTRTSNIVSGANEIEQKSPYDLFTEFYQLQNNQDMTEEQGHLLSTMIEKIWEEQR